MSTNKTQNYALHSWSPEDDFQLSEVNQNFAKLDGVVGGKAKIIVGSYAGDNTVNRTIDLGHPILAILIEHFGGVRRYFGDSTNYGGIILAGAESPLSCTIAGTCFQVSYNGNIGSLNTRQVNYHYFALVEDT